MTNQIYVYPSDIKSDNFKNRHVTITVKTSEYVQDAKEAINSALDYLKDAASFTVKDPTDAIGMKANLDANSKASTGVLVGTVVLPLPNVFTDSQSHGWSRETGIIGSIGTNLTNMTAGDIVGGVGGSLGNKVGGLANKFTGGLSVDKIIGAAANQTGTRKPLIDPGYFQNYTGSEPRTFNMTFDMVPRNSEEAHSILMIIMKLKQWSSPSRMVGGVSLLAPHWFNIEMSNPYITALAKIDRVVLSNIVVDYGADGAMQQTADGFPKFMTLTLTFQEADMSTSNDYSTVPRKTG